jgi:hypothetical protein
MRKDACCCTIATDKDPRVPPRPLHSSCGEVQQHSAALPESCCTSCQHFCRRTNVISFAPSSHRKDGRHEVFILNLKMSSFFLTLTTATSFLGTFFASAKPKVATPKRDIMLFSLPQNLRLVAAQVPYPFLFIITAGVTVAMFMKILMIVLTIPTYQLGVASTVFDQARDDFSSRWYPPTSTDINDHDRAIDGAGPMASKVVPWTGAAGSEQPEGWQYGVYNYCNMPHVRTEEYVRKDEKEWELVFVEVIQRRKFVTCICVITRKQSFCVE